MRKSGDLQTPARSHAKEDSIRKAVQIDSTDGIRVDDLPCSRARHRQPNGPLEVRDQSRAQSSTLALVERHGLQLFGLSPRQEAIRQRSCAFAERCLSANCSQQNFSVAFITFSGNSRRIENTSL